MSLLLSSPTLPVEVRSSDGHATLHVHRSVLEAIPFFSAQLARWVKSSDGPLKVELPAPVTVADLSAVLEQTYSSLMAAPPNRVQEALQTVQVASMLNVQAATIDACTQALRGLLRSEEDISLLREFVSAHDVGETANLAKRFKASSENIDFHELRLLYTRAVQSRDEELMRAARHFLKIRSRQGASPLEEAAAILAAKEVLGQNRGAVEASNTFGMDVVFHFVEAHPEFYCKLVATNFQNRGIIQQPEYVRFMNLGIMHYSNGRLPADVLASFFKLLFQTEAAPWGNSIATHLARALGRLDIGAHVAICTEVAGLSNWAFARIVDAQVMKVAAMEAKGILVAKCASFNNSELRRWLQKSTVLSLGKSLAVQFLCRAACLEPDAKTALCNMYKDESDDGF